MDNEIATSAGNKQTVRSAETGTDILRGLAQLAPSTSLSGLAKHIDMPAAKIHRYLQALMASGFAEQDPQTSHYRLGREALYVGLAALNSVDVYRSGGVALTQLRDMVEETCFLAVWGSEGATVIKVEPAPRSVTVVTQIGSVLPVFRSSTGLVFGAHLPDLEIQYWLDKDASQRPKSQALRRKDIEAQLAQIRTQRMCSVQGLFMPGINAVSAPVFNAFGGITGVLTVVGSVSNFTAELDGPKARCLDLVARKLSADMGFRDTEQKEEPTLPKAAKPGRKRTAS
ncbi:IclR family transcriptional regulator [Pseudomonas sp. v388]|uniref:IclR family transcriptional regulator n=1 Tax=Pseudomonas sp. v388 TaxID=2479849 RepID=UPI000F791C64|nr:IclR family transcriptional regulator [Pseudomonas sp. v388]RRV10525.1 IclR family transcriptional regulator [Pseudomonas sp. v388]